MRKRLGYIFSGTEVIDGAGQVGVFAAVPYGTELDAFCSTGVISQCSQRILNSSSKVFRRR